MKIMLALVTLMSMIFLSCGKSNNSSPDNRGGRIPQDRDSTLSSKSINQKIIELPGVNVATAKMAVISFLTGDRKIVSLKEEFKSPLPQNILRQKITNLVYKQKMNEQIYQHEQIKDFDEYIYLVSRWSDRTYWKFMDMYKKENSLDSTFDGNVKYSFKIGLNNLQNIDSLGNIKITTFIYNYNNRKLEEVGQDYLEKFKNQREKFNNFKGASFVSEKEYTMGSSNISPELLQRAVKARSDLAIKVYNFDIKLKGEKEIKFRTYYESIKDKYTKVIISTPKKTQVFFVSGEYSLKTFLQEKFKKVEISEDGLIVSLGEWNTQYFNSLASIDLNQADNFKKGLWTVLGEKIEFEKKLKREETIVVSYNTVNQILGSQSKDSEWLQQSNFEKELLIPNVKAGELLQLRLKGVRIPPAFLDEDISVETGKFGSGFCLGDPGGRDVHTIAETIVYESCTDIEWGQWCGIVRRLLSRGAGKNIKFKESLDQMRLRLSINGKNYLLSEFFVNAEGAVVLDGGTEAIFNLQLKRELVPPGASLKLVVLPDARGKTVKTGFIGWGDCAVRRARGFRFRHYNDNPRYELSQTVESYQIKLKKLDQQRL